jgi:N-acetyl-alpha-D-glucosaminyl L-malate synthase BshA
MSFRVGITSFATAGGSGIVATELGLHLARQGHEIHYISNAIPIRLSGFEPNVQFHQVELSSYPPFPSTPYSLALATKMTEIARSRKLDILHVHYAIPHAASAFLAKQMLAPLPLATVTTLHGTDITLVGREPSFFELTRFCIEQSDRVTAVSDWLRRETIEIFQVRKPIQVIPNFVDTENFRPRPDLQAENPLRRRGEKLVLHASNFRPVKNVPRVLEIFAAARAKVDARLIMVGDGPERGPAERQAAELGIQDDVLFLGGQEMMEELIAMADVLLLPSEYESFGLVALEAMSCAVPVVVARRGGLVEVVEHGVTGFLDDPHDVAAMAGHLIRVLDDAALAARLGAKARQVVSERWCIRNVIHQYVALYADAIDRACGRAS